MSDTKAQEQIATALTSSQRDVNHADCILINTGADFKKKSNLKGSAFPGGAS